MRQSRQMATTPTNEWRPVGLRATWNRGHNAPCIRCCSYNTSRRFEAGLEQRGSLSCPDCGKEFRTDIGNGLGPWLISGSKWPFCRKYRKGMDWETTSTDGVNDYSVTPDGVYGRRWILQVNVLQSGYWLFYGSTWTLGGAGERAESFKESWATLLTDPDRQRKLWIPEHLPVLARKRRGEMKFGGSIPCQNCGEPAFYPETCLKCGYGRCGLCARGFHPNRQDAHPEVCSECSAKWRE